MEKKKKKICMVLTNNLDHDSRVINEANSLSKKYAVKILVGDNLNTTLKRMPFEIKVVNFKSSKMYPLEMWRVVSALHRALKKERPDFIHAHDLDGLMAAYREAKRRQIPLVYDSHELFYDLPDFSNIKGFHYVIRAIEKYLMKFISAGITVNQSIAGFLKKIYGQDFIVLRNIPSFRVNAKSSVSLRQLFPNKKIILHIGGTGKLRGTQQILDSAKYLPQNYVIVFLGAKLNDPILEEIKTKKLEEKVVILPSVASSEVVEVAKEATLGLSLTLNVSLDYYYSLPNKIFQYLSAGIPIVGSNFPEFKKIILGNDVGQVVNPSQPKQIAKAIVDVVKNHNKYMKNIKKIENKYTWELESEKLINLYDKLSQND